MLSAQERRVVSCHCLRVLAPNVHAVEVLNAPHTRQRWRHSCFLGARETVFFSHHN